MKALAVCHECKAQKHASNKELRYTGTSPDEAALVDAARWLGFVYKGTIDGTIFLNIK